jgi:hypothetical protein
MPVHKLYCDTRQRIRPDLNNHADCTIQLARTIEVPDCKAFVDSFHISNLFQTIHENNKYLYVAEQLPLLTVQASMNKIYVLEEIGTAQTWRIVAIPPAIYGGANFATAAATALNSAGKALSGNYTVTFNAAIYQLTIGNPTNPGYFKIYTREVLQGMTTFGTVAISPANLQDVSDVLGTTAGAIVPGDSLNPILLTTGVGWNYRKIELAQGVYDADTLKTEIKTKLNGTGVAANMNSYDVILTSSNRFQISNANTINASFKIFPREWNDLHPYDFQGYNTSFLEAKDSYDILGFHGAVLTGSATTPIVGLGHVNLQPFHSLFLHSELGLQGDSIGPDNSGDIIRRISLDQPYGSMVHDRYSMPFDYVRVGKRNIRQLHFKLTDVYGRLVDTYTGYSFSIIFLPDSEE